MLMATIAMVLVPLYCSRFFKLELNLISCYVYEIDSKNIYYV